MSNDAQKAPDFATVKLRLAEIADAVNDESLSLDDALDMYEEAVALGLQASDLLETGIVPPDGEEDVAAGEAPSQNNQGDQSPSMTASSANNEQA